MNILRWKRKSKYKARPKTILLLIFSLIMTTFAWFAYSKVINPTLNIHLVSWDMEYYIGATKQEHPEDGIEIPIHTLYPTMEEQAVVVDIYNNGETLVDIEYRVQSVTILGTTYEIVEEGGTNTDPNYIALARPVLVTNSTTDPDTQVTKIEQLYKGVITNDITRFPFTIEIEHSAQVDEVLEDEYGNQTPGEGYLKVTVNWIGDNNELDTKWGYLVGEYFTNNPSATSAISILLSIDSYQADPSVTSLEETPLPSTTETHPYLPTGFSRLPGTNLSTGLVISDQSGNEFVWVEVPKTATIYTTAGINLTSFSETEYGQIETDLRNYVGSYSGRADVFTDYDALGFSPSNYTELKNKVLKSIYTYGGFYIGRYETGLASGYRTSSADELGTPVVKPNIYPFNYVTLAQARTLANGIAPSGYTSSLMFGLQWDLTMKYLDTKGTSTTSTSWGNYANTAYSLTNETSKYMIDGLSPGSNTLGITLGTWASIYPFEKNIKDKVLLTPGANTGFSRQNIYDLAGNLTEWTYNIISSDNYYRGGNGGNYLDNADNITVTPRTYGTYNSMQGHKEVGFRVMLIF